jgi:copper chaperone CopZ
MTQTYVLNGMTCGSCEAKVKQLIQSVPSVSDVQVSKELSEAKITTEAAISDADFQQALGGASSKYQISSVPKIVVDTIEEQISWFATYKPILLIFGYVTIVATMIQVAQGSFDMMEWMRHFMAGFFLVFSFFKMLNLKGFVDSYQMYDVIAKKFPIWGYIYAFVELGLGISFLLNAFPLTTNIITLIVMTVSIIGVIQSVLSKTTIKCACLGDVFNLPMSTVTIIEDGLMILMSFVMLLTL